MKRYWLITWHIPNYGYPQMERIDQDPVDWLLEKRMSAKHAKGVVILDHIEITAEQYTRLESLQ